MLRPSCLYQKNVNNPSTTPVLLTGSLAPPGGQIETIKKSTTGMAPDHPRLPVANAPQHIPANLI